MESNQMARQKIRITAISFALQLAEEKPANVETTARTIIEDAEQIEKYILGYEAKPEGE